MDTNRLTNTIMDVITQKYNDRLREPRERVIESFIAYLDVLSDTLTNDEAHRIKDSVNYYLRQLEHEYDEYLRSHKPAR